jgi:nucleoside-diphosphate-sugar epimerase
MRVFVTGHKGYIGTVLVPMLVAEGHEVVGLDSDLYEQCTFGGALLDVPYIRKDIRDVQVSDMEGFDAVLHLAALSNDPLGNLNPRLTYEINHTASVRLAVLAKEAGVPRFLFSSSCSTYGAAGEESVDEGADFHPVTPYGLSPRLRFDLVLNNLVAWALTTGCVYIKSDGSPWRPIVHVEDISRAFIAVLHAPREVVHTQAFNVGRTEENYQIRDLAKVVQEVVPGCRVEYAKDAEPDKRSYQVNFGYIARRLPGFQPQWDARRGAQQIYDAYCQVGLRLEDFEGPRYKRIDHIQQLLSTGRLDTTLRWRKIHEG